MSPGPTDGNGGGSADRKRIRRTAWLLAAIAAAIYVGYVVYLAMGGPDG